MNRGHTFKTSFSWGERGSRLSILRGFGIGGVPLVYDVTNEKIKYNPKQAKDMKRKCKNDIYKITTAF